MLEVKNLHKQYASVDGTPGGGIFGIDFEVAEGELFTLLGPSGCGKTTTLRSIAGLEVPNSGCIRLGGKDIYDSESRLSVPMHRRDIGMVFQSYAIWPHMDVFANAAYPLVISRKPRYSKSEINERVVKVLEMVGLVDFVHRPSTQLSGGQQQRLALARALTREPGLLLLDEPLSNLDAQLREQMRSELKRLQRETGVTFIYVTHDQSEALAISDRIAVMHNGLIAQIGTPQDIYERPVSEFVANFIGRSNLIRGDLDITVAAGSQANVETVIGGLDCTFPTAAKPRRGIAIVIRPEHIDVAASDDGAAAAMAEINRFPGVVTNEIYLGEINEYAIDVGNGQEIVVRIPPSGNIRMGAEVVLRLPPENCIALVEN
ncbi:MAG: ABC transporter ATP-binding protein [Alphaproteobacteria bacterium]|nr:ABC transporter ATP-binding protein [Alphaproteobacteria bacterium]